MNDRVNDKYECLKNAAIENILDKGLTRSQTTLECIIGMVRTLGLRYIFWDTWYSIFFAAITFLGALFIFAISPDDIRYSVAVTIAPLLFLLITVFTETSERLHGLYELKQTCRYTIRQIATLRMICYSIAGLIFITVISVVSTQDAGEFLSMFMLCLAALLLCAASSLTVMRFIRNPWATTVLTGVWILANISLSFFSDGRWETALSSVPLIIPTILVTAGAAILVYQASKLIRENTNYAHAQ